MISDFSHFRNFCVRLSSYDFEMDKYVVRKKKNVELDDKPR